MMMKRPKRGGVVQTCKGPKETTDFLFDPPGLNYCSHSAFKFACDMNAVHEGAAL